MGRLGAGACTMVSQQRQANLGRTMLMTLKLSLIGVMGPPVIVNMGPLKIEIMGPVADRNYRATRDRNYGASSQG